MTKINLSNIQPGMLFKITKPKERRRDEPAWVDFMDQYDGHIFRFLSKHKAIYNNDRFRLNGWYFSYNWLTKV